MYHFIVNKNASSGQGRRVWALLESILRAEKTSYKAYFTANRLETIQLVRKLTVNISDAEICHLVVVGGDGTLNAVMQGIENLDKIKLSCIPVGSGNDFARAMSISSRSVETLLHLLHMPQEQVIDYGEARLMLSDGSQKKSRFLISTGIGYDAEICEEVNGSNEKQVFNKLHLGQLSYVFVGLKRILQRECCDVKVTLDDEREIYLKDMFLTVAMNTPFEGGGVPFCPMANWQDGKLDICMVSSLSKVQLLFAIMLVYLKKHFIFKQINHYRCRKMKICMKHSRQIHLDGETPCKTRVMEVECKHGLHIVI